MAFCQTTLHREKTDAPVELRDILPTFLDAARCDHPPLTWTAVPCYRLPKDGKQTGASIWIWSMPPVTVMINYWCALTDGKIKYIWRIHTGTEELFDLTQDPQELHNAVNDKKYRKQLTEMRNEMIRHLSERGEEFVKDGRLVVKEKTMLYGPHYPEKENKR